MSLQVVRDSEIVYEEEGQKENYTLDLIVGFAQYFKYQIKQNRLMKKVQWGKKKQWGFWQPCGYKVQDGKFERPQTYSCFFL